MVPYRFEFQSDCFAAPSFCTSTLKSLRPRRDLRSSSFIACPESSAILSRRGLLPRWTWLLACSLAFPLSAGTIEFLHIREIAIQPAMLLDQFFAYAPDFVEDRIGHGTTCLRNHSCAENVDLDGKRSALALLLTGQIVQSLTADHAASAILHQHNVVADFFANGLLSGIVKPDGQRVS